MDIFKIIQELYEERRRIDRVIASLEELSTGKPSGEPAEPVKRKRGRPRKQPLAGSRQATS